MHVAEQKKLFAQVILFDLATALKRVVRLDEGKRVLHPMSSEAESYATILIDGETTGAKNYSLLVSEMAPNCVHSRETHDVEHGFFILSGHGVISINEEDYEVNPDMAIYVPARTVHQMKNTGTTTLKFIVIYAPPGPESKLRRRS